MKEGLLLVAFLAGAVITWFLTIHRVTREVPPTEPPVPSDAAIFGGTRSAQSSGTAGARWMGDAQDEDVLLADDTGDADATGAGRRPPPVE